MPARATRLKPAAAPRRRGEARNSEEAPARRFSDAATFSSSCPDLLVLVSSRCTPGGCEWKRPSKTEIRQVSFRLLASFDCRFSKSVAKLSHAFAPRAKIGTSCFQPDWIVTRSARPSTALVLGKNARLSFRLAMTARGSRADDDALSRASSAVPWKADIPPDVQISRIMRHVRRPCAIRVCCCF